MTRHRAVKVVALVATAAFALAALSSCSTHPGQAAVVGSTTIGDHRVDDVALALCSAQSASQQAGSSQDLSSRAALRGALSVLIDSSLSKQFAASRNASVDQKQVASLLSSRAQLVQSLPASQRAVFRDILRDSAEGQLLLVDLGRRRLAATGNQNATAQQAYTKGTQLRNAWVSKNISVSVDPRYGSYSGGALRSTDGSLSAPVSSEAVAGAKQQPSSAWIAGLPASQKCS